MKHIIYKPEVAVEIKQIPPLLLLLLLGGGDESCFVIVNTVFPVHGPPGPAHVQFEVPEPAIQDDILSIKAYVYNYLGSSARATVAIDAPNLAVLNKEIQEIIIPDGFVSEIEFSVLCTEAYLHNITLLAATTIKGVPYSDAKLLPFYIHPNGVELRNITAGYLNASNISTVLDYELDPLAIYHKDTLALYTDLMDISIESWKSLIGYPYGCIEQTLSKVIPTA